MGGNPDAGEANPAKVDAGDSIDSRSSAVLANKVILKPSPLTELQDDVHLIRAGDGFLLVGYDFPAFDNEIPHIYQGALTLDGVLSDLKDFVIDDSRMPRLIVSGAHFAVTKKDKPADQLIAIFVDYLRAQEEYRLVAFTETIADEGSDPVVLAPLPDLHSASEAQIAAGTAVSGNLGFVAWGVPIARSPISYVLLSADATTVGAPRQLSIGEPGSDWDCLATFNGTGGLGFSVIGTSADGTTTWHIVELDEAGTPKHTEIALPNAVSYCRIVGSPAPGGRYELAFQSEDGINIARYQPNGGSLRAPLVLPKTIPQPSQYDRRPVWAGAGGNDIVIGVNEGGQPASVARFDSEGVAQGAPLLLPATDSNRIGFISTWVEPNLVHARGSMTTLTPSVVPKPGTLSS